MHQMESLENSPIRPSIVEMVDSIQWLDEIEEKKKSQEQKDQLIRASFEDNFERCLVCTLRMGTCEHTAGWILRHEEDAYIAQRSAENGLREEIAETVDDVVGGAVSVDVKSDNEICLEHMAWIPLEERHIDQIGASAAKLSSPNDRIWHSSVLLDGFVVVFGGIRTKGGKNPLEDGELSYLNDVKAYDLATQSWLTLKGGQSSGQKTWPSPRYGHGAAAATKDCMILFGGRGERGRVFDDTWLFDIRSGRWTFVDTTATSPASPPARFFTACCSDIDVTTTADAEDAGIAAEIAEDRTSAYYRLYSLHNRSRRSVYLFGGTNGTDNFNDLWRFRLHFSDESVDTTAEAPVEPSLASDLADYEEGGEGGSQSPSDELDDDVVDIERNVRLEEELSPDERLALLVKRRDAQGAKRATSSLARRKTAFPRFEGRWERCAAAGDTPVPRYGHSMALLLRKRQPPGLPSQSQQSCGQGVSDGVHASGNAHEEERFILVLGGCHVSPSSEIAVGSEASAQESASLLALASQLQRCYLQENLSSVLSSAQLRLRLQQDLRSSARDGRISNAAAEALTSWLHEAGSVAALLALRERDTRRAEQLLVDAFKLHRATQQWKLSGRHMTNAARHSDAQLDVHWLRLPRVFNGASVSRARLDAVPEAEEEEEDVATLNWEVSQLGRSAGLNGAGKFHPSARMHFGACVLRHLGEARFLLVAGGIEPTSLRHLAPSGPPVLQLSSHVATPPPSSRGGQEMNIFLLDLRTMVWTRPAAVNSRLYQTQTLAMAKAEYLRAKAHLDSLEQSAVALLGRTRHLSQRNGGALGLDDILEVRQARVFCDVCRWRLETLHRSYRQRLATAAQEDRGALDSMSASIASAPSVETLPSFVPGKKVVSLLESSRRSKHAPSVAEMSQGNSGASLISSVSADSSHGPEGVGSHGLLEGCAGFALTRLGQRLLFVGGAMFANGDTEEIDLVGGGAGASTATVSHERIQKALHPASCMVLDLETQAVKNARWRRNYYASLELFRNKEEARLQMEALVSLHAIREAQRIETEARLREVRLMSFEDYRSRIPPLSRPGPVRVDGNRVNAHSVWLIWDDLIEVAAVTLRRLRFNRSHRSDHTTRAANTFMDPAMAIDLLRRAVYGNTNVVSHKEPTPSVPLQSPIRSKLTMSHGSSPWRTSDDKESDVSSLLAAISSTEHRGNRSFLTYYLYGCIGFESLQPGDVVDVLPKDVVRPRISLRPICVDPSVSGRSLNYHEQAFEECDLFFDDESPRYRGVILKSSPLSSRPGRFTVKYTDKSLETLVSRHRIRRVHRPNNESEGSNQIGSLSEQRRVEDSLGVGGVPSDTLQLDFRRDELAGFSPQQGTCTPTTLPDCRRWKLLYAGPDTHYAVTNLLPSNILETEPGLKIGVLFSLQTHGMDTPAYERSQLSQPVLVHTATSNRSAVQPGVVSLFSGLHDNDQQHPSAPSGISRTKRQVVAAVIEAQHVVVPPQLPDVIVETDDPAGLYVTRRLAVKEVNESPLDVHIPEHSLPLVLKSGAAVDIIDERSELKTSLPITINKQDNFVWSEGMGDDYV